jgi:hypothetical protein
MFNMNINETLKFPLLHPFCNALKLSMLKAWNGADCRQAGIGGRWHVPPPFVMAILAALGL